VSFILPITRCSRPRSPLPRVGRAFSIHTFSGFLGSAIAPVTVLALAAKAGLSFAVIAAGGLALLAAVPLAAIRGVDNLPAMDYPGATPTGGRLGLTSILTPTIIGLTGFFALLSLSGSGISNFSVAALTSTFFGIPLARPADGLGDRDRGADRGQQPVGSAGGQASGDRGGAAGGL
jgi:hypothetical protein